MTQLNFAKNLALYVPIKLLPALFGIFLIGFLFKHLSDEDYAYYSIIIVSAAITSQLSAGWISNSVIYHYNPKAPNSDLLQGSVLLTIVASAVTSTFTTLALLIIIPAHLAPLAWPLCVTQALFATVTACGQANFMVRQQLYAVLLQLTSQATLLTVFFIYTQPTTALAVAAITVGYGIASLAMIVFIFSKIKPSTTASAYANIVSTFHKGWNYSSGIIVWSLGMLLAGAADRYSIGYFQFENSGTYLSIKDLLTGAGGLISMPLLMLIHPIIFQKFKKGRSVHKVIEESLRTIVLIFSLGWGAIWCLGIPLFSTITGKQLELSASVTLALYVAMATSALAIYAQKRHEVHNKIRHLAKLSIASALISCVGVIIGGHLGSALWVALGALMGPTFYFSTLIFSLRKKISISRSMIEPTLVGGAVSLGIIYGLPVLQGIQVPISSNAETLIMIVIYGVICSLLIVKLISWPRFS